MNRKEYIQKIQSNIVSTGQHITVVTGGQEPRYAYTIGNKEKYNLELIFAGGSSYFEKDLYTIFNSISEKLNKLNDNLENIIFSIDELGSFKLQKVDPSWSKITMLGVFDYYGIDEINAYQVLPDNEHVTLDIPNMSLGWINSKDSAWKWLKDKWEYEVSDKVSVITNLDALKGETITEIMRWESNEWEMFAGSGPNVEEKDMRVVPMGVLFSIDDSLVSALDLKIGKGMWRDNKTGKWNDWG